MEKLPGRRILIGLCALAAVGLVGGYGVAMRAKPRSTSISLSSPTPKAGSDTKLIYVHVGGAVHRPGLYRVPIGARVDDVVRAGGGATDAADLDALNLAAKVKDGDKVLVPKRGSAGGPAAPGGAPTAAVPGGAASAGASALVNLNSATVADLETLPGIGPALAERILAFRTDRGGFRRVEDLLEVPGIGPKKFEELPKSRVTV